jgi:serine/threonine protein kinase
MPESPDKQDGCVDPLDVRVGRVLNEFLDRRACGEAVSEVDLLAEHPDIAEELRGYLALLDDVEPSRQRIAKLVAQGLLRSSEDARYLAALGPYKITGFIGQGGMGIVLKAYEEPLDRNVALKILRPDLARDEVAIKRFTQEAKAAAALQHSNIITIYGIGEDNGTHYAAMEFVSGPSLAELIHDHGPLPTELVREIFRQLLSGLGAAHEAGLIHRDIKPSNVLLRREGLDPAHGGSGDPGHPLNVQTVTLSGSAGAFAGQQVQVRITDFGLARFMSGRTRLTVSGSTFGTPQYMSPEQARGDDNIDHRTDLYSAGVVLYEMLTGCKPFEAETSSAVLHQILHLDPPAPNTILPSADSHLSALALRLMEKRPEDRLESARAVGVVLDAGRRVSSPARRRRLRRRLIVGITCIAVLSSGAWGLRWYVQQTRKSAPLNPQSLPITDADLDRARANVILSWRGNDPEPEVLYEFPDETLRITGVALVDPDGVSANGDELVVSGVDRPFNDKCLFGIDRQGTLRWGKALTPSPPIDWPDHDGPQSTWRCEAMRVLNVEGESGELAVVAQAGDQYPTSLSILTPGVDEEPQALSTFWHLGHLDDLLLVPQFFQDGRYAVIAFGNNNKLDGWGDPPPDPYEPGPGEDHPRTRYARVNALMILHPDRAAGIGPPRVGASHPLSHLSGDIPYAYAFLDQPRLAWMAAPNTQETRPTSPPTGEQSERVGYCLTEVQVVRNSQELGRIRLIVRIAVLDAQDARISGRGGKIIVDGLLNFIDAELDMGEKRHSSKDQWRRWWKPVIQDGAYVD